MAWPYEIAERDHEIQNPTSPEKIRLLGDYLRLTRDCRVLDVACGKAGPALILASTYGCRITGIEKRPAFADEARARVAASGLGSLIQVETADAAELRFEPEAWDAALCIGASFVWGTIADAAAALAPSVQGAVRRDVAVPAARAGQELRIFHLVIPGRGLAASDVPFEAHHPRLASDGPGYDLEGVYAWRMLCLVEIGYPVPLAEKIADRLDVDVHRAVELVERGCDPELAAEVLL